MTPRSRRHPPKAEHSRRPRRAPVDPVRLAVARAYLRFLEGGPFRESPPATLTDSTQQRFFSQLLHTMVRHQRLLEAELARLASRPLQRIDPELRTLAVMGLAQLRLLQGVPPHAAVNETVALAAPLKRPHGKGWVNGVLRSAQRATPVRTDDLPLAERTSHPDWMVTRWNARYGEAKATAICEANNHFGGVTLRVENRRIAADALAARLAEEGVPVTPHPLWPSALHVERVGEAVASPAFAEGLFYIQDISSQLLMAWVARELKGPVLDACAAPGGKISHLLALHDTPPRALAADPAPEGLARLRENFARLGLPLPPLIQADGRHLPIADAVPGTAFGTGFGAVLLDVPCSATGTIRKHPDLKWRKFEDDLPVYARKQATMLDEAARVLGPGGTILYSTCSLEPEENEEQVQRFLARHAGFQRVSLAGLAPPAGLAVEPGSLLTADGDMLLLPSRDCMGLYAALLRRTA